jgi:hypothetical protein
MSTWIKVAAMLMAACIAYGSGYANADKRWRASWSERDAADARQTTQREAWERAEEQRRQVAISQVIENAEKQLTAARSDAAVAESAADGLRSQLRHITRQLADSETGRLTSVARAGASEGKTAILLAGLLRESDELAGKFAAEADDAYERGAACERIYEGVTGNQPNIPGTGLR